MANEKELINKAKNIVAKFKNKGQTIDNKITNQMVDEGKLPESQREIYEQNEVTIGPRDPIWSKDKNAKVGPGSMSIPNKDEVKALIEEAHGVKPDVEAMGPLKYLDEKYYEKRNEMGQGESQAERDDDIDTLIEMIGFVAGTEAGTANKLLPTIERQVAKVAEKKVAPGIIEKLKRGFSNKRISSLEDDVAQARYFQDDWSDKIAKNHYDRTVKINKEFIPELEKKYGKEFIDKYMITGE